MNQPQVFSFSLWRLLLVFGGIFFVLQWSYEQAAGGPLETAVIDSATVKPAAYFINYLSPEQAVKADGHRLVSGRTRLSVLNGCEGTESLFLMIAAILAYKTGWQHKLLGIVASTAVIFVTNQARIVALYFSLLENRQLFVALHGYIAPTIIVAVGAGFYLWWLQWPQQIEKFRSR